jgi:hypothetical protein
MNKQIEFECNKDCDFYLCFQGDDYSKGAIEKYYDSKKKDSNGSVEFLPGIFIEINTSAPQGIKKLIQKLFSLSPLKILNDLANTFFIKIIKFNFCNKRDNYALYVNNELRHSNSKNVQCKTSIPDFDEYKTDNTNPQYIIVSTEKVLFPFSSGGGGDRCSLKGVFMEIGLFSPVTEGYSFLSEYEMHYLVTEIPNLRKLCEKCVNCMNTVDLMRNGNFVGPTIENNEGCLTLYEYDGMYKIGNGNHRACCAKVFNIASIKAKVYTMKRVDNKADVYQNIGNVSYNSRVSPNNSKILDSFYSVFEKNSDLNFDAIREYLQNDGTDKGLIKLVQTKIDEYLYTYR